MNRRQLRSRILILGMLAPVLLVLGLVGACKFPKLKLAQGPAEKTQPSLKPVDPGPGRTR